MPEHEEFKQQESEQDFAQRVLERTGVALERMQEGAADDMIASHIFCVRGGIMVVATGYPSRIDETTREEFWDDPTCFRKINLRK